MLRSVFALIVLATSLSAGDAPDAKKELAKLQGTWNVKELHYDGQQIDNDKAKFKFTIKGNQASIGGNDDLKKDYAGFSFKIDPSATPQLFDIKITLGGQKDVAMEGIYAVKGDELKICLQVIGTERPSEFKAPEGANIAYLILRKE